MRYLRISEFFRKVPGKRNSRIGKKVENRRILTQIKGQNYHSQKKAWGKEEKEQSNKNNRLCTTRGRNWQLKHPNSNLTLNKMNINNICKTMLSSASCENLKRF